METPPDVASSAAPPNFLFLFPDQCRWDWLGCEQSPHGKVPVRTPNIDRLAARGVRFANCRTNSPLCAPARACLATGMRYERCGVPRNNLNLDPTRLTFLQLLRQAGYRVAASGKTDLQRHGDPKGLDGWTRAMGQLGFTECVNQCGKWNSWTLGWPEPQDPYTHYLHQRGLIRLHLDDYERRNRMRRGERRMLCTQASPLEREDYSDDFCGRMGLSFLERWAVGEPWMLWVNFPGPHEPFDPPAGLQRRYDGVEFPPPVEPGESPQDHQQIRRNYAAMIEGIDEWVGRLLDAIERRGEAGRTVIVFCSDHGEMLGDHGRWSKSVPQEGSVHIPLVIAGPGVRSGIVSSALVELIDLSATFLDLAGLQVPPSWDARSLAPILSGSAPDASHRTVQHSALENWQMVCDGRYKLTQRSGQPSELYDLLLDPGERRNVLPDHPDLVQSLAQHLQATMAPASLHIG